MSAHRLFAGVGIASVAAVAVALVSQYEFDLRPCPWCVLQRAIFLAVAICCAIGFAWRRAPGRLLAGGLGLLFALAGIAAALWQHFQAAAAASCNLTLADKIMSGWLGLDALLPEVFAPRASCADAQVNLLGVPYDFWSLGLFVVIALILWRTLRLRSHEAAFSG